MKNVVLFGMSVLWLGATQAEVPAAGLGWRYDGSGVYTGCHPPVSWEVEKKENVRWSIETPNWGYGQPLEVGESVVTAPRSPVLTTWQDFGDERIGTSFPVPVSDGKTLHNEHKRTTERNHE